ncbi:hypothetical protein CEXT_35971 [Caerostris extrusa]|uniref:Uncharacterized protein n=1 Tax=Caerostris extrusa TaxID=172846 RepID=A0AAV4MEN0_CAEEX|nr:hypothetical protein CEXT_35971 [Caerostris extrusa]
MFNPSQARDYAPLNSETATKYGPFVCWHVYIHLYGFLFSLANRSVHNPWEDWSRRLRDLVHQSRISILRGSSFAGTRPQLRNPVRFHNNFVDSYLSLFFLFFSFSSSSFSPRRIAPPMGIFSPLSPPLYLLSSTFSLLLKELFAFRWCHLPVLSFLGASTSNMSAV